MTDALLRLGMTVPIILAPMGGAAGPELASAVSNAGGLGLMPHWRSELGPLRDAVRATQARTNRSFGINLRMTAPEPDLLREARLEVLIEEGVKAVSFFWGQSDRMISRARDAGVVVLQTVGTAAEAKAAADAGADIVVAQGWEAGGHVWSQVTTLALVPAVVDAVGDVPVIAAGGIADGRGLAAALALGARGAWIGTRFLASEEATIHDRYRERLYAANEADTWYGDAVFNVGWMDAPHRTLRNKTVIDWQAAGRPPTGSRPGEGEIIATSPTRGNSARYQSIAPTSDTTGDIDAMSLWAGQGVALVHRTQPAAEIVAEIWADAQARIAALHRGLG